MSPKRRSDIDAELQELYDQVPEVECKGLCHTSCGPIRLSNRERTRIKEASGITVPDADPQDFPLGEIPDCPALTADKRCGAYEVRPMLCRLWGAVESMPCEYGCRPKDGQRLLADEDGYRLIAESLSAGGSSGRAAALEGRNLDETLKLARRHRAVLRENIAGGAAADRARASAPRVPGTFSRGL